VKGFPCSSLHEYGLKPTVARWRTIESFAGVAWTDGLDILKPCLAGRSALWVADGTPGGAHGVAHEAKVLNGEMFTASLVFPVLEVEQSSTDKGRELPPRHLVPDSCGVG